MIKYERNGIVVRASRESDVAALSGRLRDADEQEVIAAGNVNGEACLAQSFARSSLRYTVALGELPVAMFGIVPDEDSDRSANVWFLGAPEMSRIKKTFVKLSRKFIADFLVEYPVLWNAVDARYVSSIRWLESCGALFHPYPIELNSVPFYRFVIRREA